MTKPLILIVDDMPSNLQVLAQTLATDHEIKIATNGQLALELAGLPDEPPDLILLDIMMPGMDGYEVCRRLKADARTARIPVIFITALSEEADEARGLDVGAIDYITKPFNPAVVQARVRNHLTLKHKSDLLERLAALDGLTGLANRRRFDAVLAEAWEQARHSGQPVSLILTDVDQFKRYNDHFGHGGGDTCLRQVARVLAEIARPTDTACRYGGEEFALVMPETEAREAAVLAERLRAGIEALNLAAAPEAIHPCVTVSVGHATWIPDAASRPDGLIEAADQALYRAKEHGRNRVEAAPAR